MNTNSLTDFSAKEVLGLITEELKHPRRSVQPDHDLERRVYLIREMQRSFRQEPIGGRLVPVKRLVTWFSASAFDRQSKVVEALVDLIEDLVQESEALAARVAELEREASRIRRTNGPRAD
jgi:hypothetical protein